MSEPIREAEPSSAVVVAVASDSGHHFSKPIRDRIELVAGLGVEGDAHAGSTDQHRFHRRWDKNRPNLRQVHLIHAELFDEVALDGFALKPGAMGENITTRGVDLLGLPHGTVLRIGGAEIEVTGLRNPCVLIDRMTPGLRGQMVRRHQDGTIERRSGIMGVVRAGGPVQAGDGIDIELPEVHEPLQPV